uniref:Uncharacterized protein n=1 Tax=Arundo donax TaxID=35708 RepID=A0A0A9G7B1_ARUDO
MSNYLNKSESSHHNISNFVNRCIVNAYSIYIYFMISICYNLELMSMWLCSSK